jgi:hypothetical protein
MPRNTKSLKRNDEARKGILIAPSKLPRFFLVLELLTPNLFIHGFQQMSASGPRFTARMASRQTLHRKLGKSAGERCVNNLRGTFGSIQ